MKRMMSVLNLKSGARDEYKRRHDEIWPEMTELLNRQGIHNYTIWLYGDKLFLYREVDEEAAQPLTPELQAVAKRWDAFMADILSPDDGNAPELMFLHE